MASTILSDNGVSSGSAGLKSTADSTGVLALQTSTSGGTATTAVTIDTSQNVGIGTTTPSSYGKFVVVSGASYINNLVNSSTMMQMYGQPSTAHIRMTYQSVADWDILAGSAGQLSFSANSTERMRIDSSGNLLVGVTSSTAGRLAVKDVSGSGNNVWLIGRSSDGTSSVSFRNNADSAYNARIECFDTGTMTFATGTSATERMRIDSSGNVGIGTTSPSNKLAVSQTVSGADAKVRFFNTATAASSASVVDISNDGDLKSAWRYNNNTGDTDFGNLLGAYNLKFYTNATERMRIDSSGNVLVNTTGNATFPAKFYAVGTSTYGALAAAASGSGAGYPVYFQDTDATSASQQLVHFNRGSTTVGYITTTNTTTSYGSASDYRLKEDIQPMTGALAKVAQLKPVTYKWKADDSIGEGFIAHELQEVCPIAVHGTKDAVDKDGNPDYQGIDTSFLVATLTAAIQELSAKNDALTARIVALESRT